MNHPTTARDRADTAAPAALFASAFVLLGLIIVAAGRLSPAAHADAVNVGDLSVLTASAGANEDVLVVLDRREESLFVYGVEQGRRLELLQRSNIKELFLEGRNAAGGAGPR
ncbi:MAG: hypothetical protein IBJ11_11430 [Phycisphaerales bacterium]|nr:hypothetical protein [Phycisphaerales bacterium]